MRNLVQQLRTPRRAFAASGLHHLVQLIGRDRSVGRNNSPHTPSRCMGSEARIVIEGNVCCNVFLVPGSA
jgi:hypothetical protein